MTAAFIELAHNHMLALLANRGLARELAGLNKAPEVGTKSRMVRLQLLLLAARDLLLAASHLAGAVSTIHVSMQRWGSALGPSDLLRRKVDD
ncbi:hypothetical protein ACXHXM_04910